MKRLLLLALLIITCSLFSNAQTPAGTSKHTNIIDSLRAAGDFRTLLTALNESRLTETLKGKGPFTIFAPDDNAFAKLQPGVLKALMQDPGRLKSFLLYHVTAGTLSTKDLRNRTDKSITMMEGSKAYVQDGFDYRPSQSQQRIIEPAFHPRTSEPKDDRLRSAGPSKETQENGLNPALLVINGSARVFAGDISASNGIIHVVDTVLTKPHP